MKDAPVRWSDDVPLYDVITGTPIAALGSENYSIPSLFPLRVRALSNILYMLFSGNRPPRQGQPADPAQARRLLPRADVYRRP